MATKTACWDVREKYKMFLKQEDCASLTVPLEDIKDGMQGLFSLDSVHTHLNHGGYGAAFRLSLDSQRWFQSRMESSPSRFMERDYIPALRAAVLEVASFVGAGNNDIVPVRNVTTAVNAILKSVTLQEGDLYLMTSLTYPAVRNCIVMQAARTNAGILEVKLDKDTLRDKEKIMEAFKAALEAGRPRVKLAILDHVISFPPVVMPIQELASLCQAEGSKILVDGSHAIGALPLKLSDMKVHFYASNMHKWLCTPKGTAFLWVDPREQENIHPVVTSHGCGLGFQQEFIWAGTDDMSAWMSVPASLAIFQKLGPQTIRSRNLKLLGSAVDFLLGKWKTKEVFGLNDNGVPMAAVKLPSSSRVSQNASGAWAVHEVLRSIFHIEVPVVWWEGGMWVRISANLYNTMKDYYKLGEAVPKLQRYLLGQYSMDLEAVGAANRANEPILNGHASSSSQAEATLLEGSSSSVEEASSSLPTSNPVSPSMDESTRDSGERSRIELQEGQIFDRNMANMNNGYGGFCSMDASMPSSNMESSRQSLATETG